MGSRAAEILNGGSPERRRSIWSMVGLGGRALLAAVTFVAIARALGTAGYGVYIGITAYVGLLAPLASLGVGEVLVKRVSRDTSELREAWGATLGTTFTTGAALYLATVALALIVLPNRDVATIALFGGVEFLSVGVVHNHARACAALDRYPALAAVHIADAAARAVVAFGFWASGSTDLRVLAVLMLASMALVSLATGMWLRSVAGGPIVRRSDLVPAAKEGSQFALGDASQMIQGGVDKTMLLRAGFDADAGLYGAGARLIAYSMLPASSIFSAAYPEFFRRGAEGIDAAIAYSRQLRGKVIAVTLGGAFVAVLFSPLAGFVLGDEFDGVVPVVIAMALYPVLRGLQVLSADVLSGTGHQSYRSKAQLSTAVLNIGLNIALIPEYSWKGAAIATYISELAFLALLIIGVRRPRG